jgi:hypothetical protein
VIYSGCTIARASKELSIVNVQICGYEAVYNTTDEIQMQGARVNGCLKCSEMRRVVGTCSI